MFVSNLSLWNKKIQYNKKKVIKSSLYQSSGTIVYEIR